MKFTYAGKSRRAVACQLQSIATLAVRHRSVNHIRCPVFSSHPAEREIRKRTIRDDDYPSASTMAAPSAVRWPRYLRRRTRSEPSRQLWCRVVLLLTPSCRFHPYSPRDVSYPQFPKTRTTYTAHANAQTVGIPLTRSEKFGCGRNSRRRAGDADCLFHQRRNDPSPSGDPHPFQFF